MTTKYNLTSRTKTPPDKVFGTFIKEQVGEKLVYTPRFSQIYQREGHSFYRSFKVVFLGYLIKYKIIDWDDKGMYDTLQALYEEDEPFTIQGLAGLCGKSTASITRIFENLINAELLQIVTVADGQGQPNYYIIRTPYFERKALKSEAVCDSILAAYGKLPETFLEDHADRLKKQVETNALGRLRFLKNEKRKIEKDGSALSEMLQAEHDRLAEQFTGESVVLHRVFKTLRKTIIIPDGEKEKKHFVYTQAVEFDDIVRETTRTMPQTSGSGYWTEFKARIRNALLNKGFRFTTYLYDLAVELSALYDLRIVKQAAASLGKAAKAIEKRFDSPSDYEHVGYDDSDDEDEVRDEYFDESPEYVPPTAEESRLRALLREKLAGKSNFSTWHKSEINKIVELFRSFQSLPAEIIKRVAGDNLPEFIARKIVEQLE